MKLASILAWLCAASSAVAQLSVEVKFDQEQFLIGEELQAAVRVTNRSGQTLKLGDEPDWLLFSMEERDGTVVRELGKVPVLQEFELASSMVATRRVELARYFAITHPGTYKVVATVRVREWGQEFSSPAKSFTVINGSKLWTRAFGVPLPAGATNRQPEVRRYTLQQANFLNSRLRLYLRLTSADGNQIFKVVPIGPFVSFGKPEPQLDEDSNLHLLHQTGAHRFCYTVHSPDGNLLLRQTYEYKGARPRLTADEKGRFQVLNGVRIPMPDDFPPPPTAQPDVKSP